MAAFLLSILVAVLAASNAWSRDRVKLHAAFPAALPVLGDQATAFARRATAGSDGALAVRHFEPGALLPRFAYLDAVVQGAVDAAWGTPAVAGGRIRALALFTGMPFGPDVAGHRQWMEEAGGRALYDRLYAGLGVRGEPCAFAGADAAGWFRTPLAGPEPFRGLAVRTFGLTGRVLERLGAEIRSMFGSDLYIALKTGTIDAAESGPPYVDYRIGLHQVAPVYYVTAWHQPAVMLDVVFSTARWQALSPAAQAAVAAACAATRDAAMAADLVERPAALAAIAAAGVDVRELPDAVVETLRAAWLEVAAAEAAADPDFAAVLASVRAFQAGAAR